MTDLYDLERSVLGHLLDSVPAGRLREAPWNQHPVGNGPFKFVAHETNRRWIFVRNPDFPMAEDGRLLIPD